MTTAPQTAPGEPTPDLMAALKDSLTRTKIDRLQRDFELNKAGWAAEIERTKALEDDLAAERERYRHLAEAVERHAGAQCPCDTNGECLARLYESLTALAATAPQTAPGGRKIDIASLAMPMSADEARAFLAAADECCGKCAPGLCYIDARNGEQFTGRVAEPSPAVPEQEREPESVGERCTATTSDNGVTLRCEHEARHEGWHDADLIPPPGRVGWANEADMPLWARTAPDEHLQALRDELDRIWGALGIAKEVDAVHEIRSRRAEQEADQQYIRELIGERDKARREAEWLRGEVDTIADEWAKEGDTARKLLHDGVSRVDYADYCEGFAFRLRALLAPPAEVRGAPDSTEGSGT